MEPHSAGITNGSRYAHDREVYNESLVEQSNVKLLLVDDNAASLIALSAVFEMPGVDLLCADSGDEALGLLLKHDVAAIVLDVNMPVMDGFETARLIRSRKHNENTPILFLTGYRDDTHLARGYALRAVDFLFKPVSPEVLRSKISVFVSLARNARLLVEQREAILQMNAELERKVEERTAALSIAMEEARLAKAEADAANASKSYFLAQLTHELRTPLNAVIGYTEMLEEEAAAKELNDFLPDIRKIQRAASHLASLINDVLDLSKIEAGKTDLAAEEFAVPAMINELAVTAEPLAARNGNSLEVVCDENLGTMRSDPTKVRQCLLNLLSNATRFTRDGIVRLAASGESNLVRFRVEDSGIGMTPEQMKQLFNPFTQVHRGAREGGTGLGLTITRHLCTLLGGDISVESEAGKGSTMTVTLPRNIAQAAASQA